MIKKDEYCVLHKLEPRGDVKRRLFACEQLVERQTQKRFLHRIITEDENEYITITPRATENHGDYPVVILLSAEYPCPKSHALRLVVISQHNNARPHVAKLVMKKISRNVEMANLTSPAVPSRCYSVSFSPHSPRSMAQGLADQHFSSYEEVKNWIGS
nr:Mariner Mos1 transposase [Hymenolepis microstoma]